MSAPTTSLSTSPSTLTSTSIEPAHSTEPSQSSVSAPITKPCNNIITQNIRNSQIRNDVNSSGRVINIRQILENIISLLEVHKTNNKNNGINKALANINNLKEEYINIYKNVYCKDDSGRTLPNTNNCKTKKQLNKINSYFTNKNVTENNNGNEHNNSYNNETFLKNINKYKQLGLRINNSSKVKVYRSVYNKELKKFTDKHKTTLLKLECLLKNVNNELFKLTKKSKKIVKNTNIKNTNITNLKALKKAKPTVYKYFSKLNPFVKKSNDNQTTEQSATPENDITYNKKKHKELKNTMYNKLRQKKIKNFIEDINQIFTDTDGLL